MLRPARLRSVCQWSLLVASTLLLMTASTIVVPAWSMVVLMLHVVASEEGIWLMLVTVLILVASAMPSPHRRLRFAASAQAVVAGILLMLPLYSIPQTIRHAESGLAQVFGHDGLVHLPQELLSRMRPQPFSVWDALWGIPLDRVPSTEITIPSAGGPPLSAIRYGGTTSGKLRPVIVAMHGGGWRGGRTDECEVCHRYLASHGYVVYAIDYRTAPGTPFPGQLDDVRLALAWIMAHAAEADGDSSRMVVMGRSAGAQLASLVAYAHPEPALRAVVTWYGPIDLAIGYREPPHPDPLDVRAHISDYLGSTPDEDPVRYAQASPITYATRPQPPTLLISGGSDQVVYLSYQRQMRDRLAAAGTSVGLIELPWAEHGFDHLANGPSAQISLYYLERFLALATAAR